MRVLVLGAYGLIGSSVARRLVAAGHEVVGLGRAVASARIRHPDLQWIVADLGTLTSPAHWRPLLDRVDAVVNCAGALQDGPRDNLQAVQSDSMRALYDSCVAEGVRRVVTISAAGVSREATTAFFRTKAEADEALERTDLEWFILRPGLVLAPEAYGGTALVRALASCPGVVPLVRVDQPLQTIGIDDLAEAVTACLDGRVPSRRAYDLVEAERHALRDVVTAFRQWLGRKPAPIVEVPPWFARIVAASGDALAWLGWRSPLRTTAIRQLESGVCGDARAWEDAGGEPVRSLHQTLRRMPSTVQERWFGRVWLLKPVIIATLSLFWLATGLIALARFGPSLALLVDAGLPSALATGVAVATALLDIALGLAVLIRRTLPAAALGMVVTTALYLVAASVMRPDLWVDPLGPLIKPIPGAVLALVALAITDER